MESSEDKEWAYQHLLDPINGPAPSEESGPGTSFRSTFASEGVDTKKGASTSVRPVDGETTSVAGTNSARQSRIPASLNDSAGQRSSIRTSSEIPTSSRPPSTYDSGTLRDSTHRRRTSSLTERFPGDESHRPLDIIRRESKKANRAPHLRKAHHHGPDSIDRLAAVDGSDIWHHDGPFEAASLARNRDFKNSPLEAVASTNAEALKATPREKVLDSIQRHRPLDGVAFVPPGFPDRYGRVFRYEEGTDMQRDAASGGDLGRWPGIKYLPDDIKGKGEPSYSIEKALKDHNRNDHRRVISEGGIEMKSNPRRTSSLRVAGSGNEQRYSQWESELRRSGSTSHAEGRNSGFRQRLGSLRRRKERQNAEPQDT